MKKEKSFEETRFNADVIKELISVFSEISSTLGKDWKINGLSVQHTDSTWYYDTIEEFIADYRRYDEKALVDLRADGLMVHIQINARYTYAVIEGPDRLSIESIFDVFEKNAAASQLAPEEGEDKTAEIKVFIGHGQSQMWRDLKDHLQDKHGLSVIAYETGARAGHTIRDVLEDMARSASFALIVMTAEDEQQNGGIRARQNVVHEAGLFQGSLGFSKAVMLVEDGVEDFSNIFGVQQIRFSTGNIKETFGEVLATLKREFY